MNTSLSLGVTECAVKDGEKENPNDWARQSDSWRVSCNRENERERVTRVRIEGLLQVCAVPEPRRSHESKFGLDFSQRLLIVLSSEGLFI